MKQSLIKQTATAIKSTHTQLAKGKQPVEKQTIYATKPRTESEHLEADISSGNTWHDLQGFFAMDVCVLNTYS